MTDTPAPTLAELQAQAVAIQMEIDKRQVAPLTAIVDAFSNPAVADAVTVVQEQLEQLTGEARQQAQNILTVLQNSPQYLKNRRDAIQAQTAPVPVGDLEQPQ